MADGMVDVTMPPNGTTRDELIDGIQNRERAVRRRRVEIERLQATNRAQSDEAQRLRGEAALLVQCRECGAPVRAACSYTDGRAQVHDVRFLEGSKR